MRTLEGRIADLEMVSKRARCVGFFGLEIPPPMGHDEWCRAAAKQQAELIGIMDNEHA